MRTGNHSAGAAGAQARAPKQRHTARNVIIIIAIIVVAVVLCGVSLYMSGRAALSDAQTLQGQMSTLSSQVSKNQVKKARSTAREMGTTAADLNNQMSNPLWRVASLAPGYGSDIAKVIDLAGVADDLTNDALVPVLQNVTSLKTSSFVTKGGNLNVKQIVPLVQALGNVAPVIQRSNGTVSSMGDSNIQQINTVVVTLKAVLPTLENISQVSSELSPVIGDLLGTEGKRTYLLVAQNNAEMRSVGGFPGSMGPLTINNGKIKLGEFKSVYDYIPRLDGHPVKAATSDEKRIFSTRMNFIPGDVGQIVNFERVATIWNTQWNRSNKTKIDGIIAMDPVFLQNLLKLTGGFTAPNGWAVNGDNAAEILMNRAYTDIPIAQTDAFFASVAGQAFQTVRDNLDEIGITDLSSTFSDGADEGRLHVWMKDDDEESAMRSLGVTGELSEDTANPVLGVYMSDFAWSKIGWYLDRDVTIGTATKNADGTSTYDVSVTLTNTMTKKQFEEAAAAQDYIYGSNTAKRSKDDMVYFLYLVAPAGGSISNVETEGYFGHYSTVNSSKPLDGKKNDRTMAQTTYEGYELWGGETQMKRGQKTTVSFQVTVPDGAQGNLQVAGTPSANPDIKWSTNYN